MRVENETTLRGRPPTAWRRVLKGLATRRNAGGRRPLLDRWYHIDHRLTTAKPLHGGGGGSVRRGRAAFTADVEVQCRDTFSWIFGEIPATRPVRYLPSRAYRAQIFLRAFRARLLESGPSRPSVSLGA